MCSWQKQTHPWHRSNELPCSPFRPHFQFHCMFTLPDAQCMVYLSTYIWLILMVNVGKYTIHWVSGPVMVSFDVLFFSDSLAGDDFAVTWKVYRRWSCHQQACGLKRHVGHQYHGYIHHVSRVTMFFLLLSTKTLEGYMFFFPSPP